MEKLIKKNYQEIIKKYSQNVNVLGIMLFGSAARNKFDRYSDIDIYVLLKKKGRYSRQSFIKSSVRVDIILDTIKEIQNYLKEDKRNIRRNTSHILAYGQIIYQKTDDLKKLQQMAKKNLILKTRCSKKEILMHKYSIDDFWGEVQRDFKNNDFIAFGLDSQLLISSIIELFLKLKGKFLRQPNEMSALLKKLDSSFYIKIKSFYTANNPKGKLNLLSRLVKFIYEKSGGPLPRKWSID